MRLSTRSLLSPRSLDQCAFEQPIRNNLAGRRHRGFLLARPCGPPPRPGACVQVAPVADPGDRVEIALGAEIGARHRRSYVRGDVVYDPLHYLSLLEKKPGALDQAAPLRGWKLDPAFDPLRRLLEARFGPRGKREYIQVLRLHEDLPQRQVAAAVRDAVKRRLIGFDAVKHLLVARIERRPAHLDLSHYPHLPQPFVAATRSADHATLLAGGAGHG